MAIANLEYSYVSVLISSNQIENMAKYESTWAESLRKPSTIDS